MIMEPCVALKRNICIYLIVYKLTVLQTSVEAWPVRETVFLEWIVRGCCQIFKKRHFKHELSWCIFMLWEEVWFNASWLWGDPVFHSPCPLACLVMGCSGGGGQGVLDVLIKRHCLWALCLPKCTWEGTLLLCHWVEPRALVWCWRFLNLSGECSFFGHF